MGVLLLVVGVGVLAFGLLNHLKGKRILAAPFKKTGELARNPVSEDPKGAMSTEGKVIPPAEPLLSPCTKQACLYYEVKVERLYEKTETTQDGTKTVKGSTTLDTVKGGAQFGLDDGTGVVAIDVSKGADFDNLKEGYKKELNGRSWASNVQFGEFNFEVPVISSDDGWTIGFKATEKYVPVEGNLFVLGKLEGSKIIKPGWRSMVASNKGREGLLGSIQKKKKFSFIGGGVAAVLSIPLMIFGPKADPNAIGASCPSAITDTRVKCSAQVYDKDGDHYAWTVTKAGTYELEVFAPAKKIPFLPELVVKDSEGAVLADEEGGSSAKATVELKPGTYNVVVKPADAYMVKGGYSYDMEFRSNGAAGGAAVAQGDQAKGPLSDADLKGRVGALNELCGDTWCEGSFNYKFTALSCAADAKSCTLSFSAKNSDTKKSYVAQVEVKGFTTVVPDDDGQFDTAVGDALTKWEKAPRNVTLDKGALTKSAKPAAKTVAVAAPAKAAPAPAAKAAPAPAAKAAPAAAPRATPAPAPAAPKGRGGKNLQD